MSDSCQALAGSIPSVISTLYVAAAERNTEGRALLQGLAKDMATYKFVHMTHFLADAVGLLGIVSKSMQVENPTYACMKSTIDAAIISLEALKTMNGPYLSKLKDQFPEIPPDHGTTEWQTHEFKDNKKERAQYKKASEEFLEATVLMLTTTFPDHEVMNAFSIFDPTAEVQNPEEQLNRLLELYGKVKKSQGKEFHRLVDADQARSEWCLLKELLPVYKSTEDLYIKFLKKNDGFQEIGKLVAICLTINVTSVNCERVVSRYNATKTDSRNSLSVESVDRLITLSFEAPPYQAFDYQSAFEEWAMKDRRAFNTIDEKCQETEQQPMPNDNLTDQPLDLSKNV